MSKAPFKRMREHVRATDLFISANQYLNRVEWGCQASVRFVEADVTKQNKEIDLFWKTQKQICVRVCLGIWEREWECVRVCACECAREREREKGESSIFMVCWALTLISWLNVQIIIFVPYLWRRLVARHFGNGKFCGWNFFKALHIRVIFTQNNL